MGNGAHKFEKVREYEHFLNDFHRTKVQRLKIFKFKIMKNYF